MTWINIEIQQPDELEVVDVWIEQLDCAYRKTNLRCFNGELHYYDPVRDQTIAKLVLRPGAKVTHWMPAPEKPEKWG
jgi:hypothetical protein